MKKLLLIISAISAFVIALASVLFLASYVTNGAGLQLFGPLFSSVSVVFGTLHIIGFSLLALISAGLGVGLLAHACVPADTVSYEPESAAGHSHFSS